MNEFLLVAGMALVTFALRYPVLALLGRIQLPTAIRRALGFVPAAVLAALIAPAMFMPDGQHIVLHYRNAALIAGSGAVVVAWRSRNLLLAIVTGMAIFLAWRWLLPLSLPV